MKDETAAALLRSLGRPDAKTKVEALDAFLSLYDGETRRRLVPAERLLPLLRDCDPEVRQRTAWLLGQLGDPRGVPELMAAWPASDVDEAWLRRHLLLALGDIGALDAIRPERARLVRLLEERPAPGARRAIEEQLWRMLTPELFALLRLVARFVERQALPHAVLLEKRPDLLGLSAQRPPKREISDVSRGHWGAAQEWAYGIHGRGCRMQHVSTEEPLDWLAPDLMKIDPYCFYRWLAWRLARGDGDSDSALVAACLHGPEVSRRQTVFAMLRELARAGTLRYRPSAVNAYRLVAGTPSRGAS